MNCYIQLQIKGVLPESFSVTKSLQSQKQSRSLTKCHIVLYLDFKEARNTELLCGHIHSVPSSFGQVRLNHDLRKRRKQLKRDFKGVVRRRW